MALDREMETYRAKLPELAANEGKFVLISGDQVADMFDTYADAIKDGYRRFGLSPFLVKQIQVIEPVEVIQRPVVAIPAR